MSEAKKKRRVLVVDDEEALRRFVAEELTAAGYAADQAGSGEAALAAAAKTDYDLVLLDLKMPGLDGLETLARLRAQDEAVAVILLTGHGTIAGAVAAMKAGAFTYLTKPCDLDELFLQIERALENRDLKRRTAALSEAVGSGREIAILGEDAALRRTIAAAEKVAAGDSGCLILGESGTGKELLARLIHARSPRRGGVLMAINCANFQPALLESELFGHERGSFTGATATKLGLLEVCRGGTLFLDEIGDLPLEVQAKLLRVLESGEYRRLGGEKDLAADVRFVAATHRDLAQAVAAGSFRRDLYYRINVVTLTLPPLRERRGDIPLLAAAFLDRFAVRGRPLTGIAPAALARLQQYDWPGNIRELENVIERAAILAGGEQLTLEDLPDSIGHGAPCAPPAAGTIAAMERKLVEETLRRLGWHRDRAAAELGISVKTLYRKIRDYGLVEPKGS